MKQVEQVELDNYQHDIINFIAEKKRCALWVGCGLGKTLTVLTAFSKLKQENETMLVVAPLKIANDVWFSEIEKWLHLKNLSYSIVTGAASKREKAIQKKADIYIINIENVVWLLEHKRVFNWLVVDESTSIKNYTSKCFIALSGYKHFVNYSNRKIRTGIKSDYCILLSGTPTPQGLIDLYSQIYLLDKGQRLGKTMTEFRDTYFYFDERKYKYTIKSSFAQKAIYNKVKDVTLSLETEDYITLPQKTEITIRFDYSMSKYKKFFKEKVLEIGEQNITAKNAGVLTGKLMQFCNGFVYDNNKNSVHIHDEKINALKKIVKKHKDENIIVVYFYNEDLNMLLRHFPDAVVLTSTDEKELWNYGSIKMLLCQQMSVSEGFNLQDGGNIIVWFSLTFDYKTYTQMNARIYRRGQEKDVTIYRLAMSQGKDEDAIRAIENKGNKMVDFLRYLKDDIKKMFQKTTTKNIK